MQKTKNYNLNKPDSSDQYNIKHFNDNADTIDKALDDIIKGNTPVQKVADGSVTKLAPSATMGGQEIATTNTWGVKAFKVTESGWYKIGVGVNESSYSTPHNFSIGTSWAESEINSVTISTTSTGRESEEVISFAKSDNSTTKLGISYPDGIHSQYDVYVQLGKNNESKWIFFFSDVSLDVADTLEKGKDTHDKEILIKQGLCINGIPIATTKDSVESLKDNATLETSGTADNSIMNNKEFKRRMSFNKETGELTIDLN